MGEQSLLRRLSVVPCAIVVGAACVNQPAEQTTARTSAITQSPAAIAETLPHREDDFGAPPGYVAPAVPVAPGPPPPAPVPAAQHPGHFKVDIAKGRLKATPAVQAVVPRRDMVPSQAELATKQAEFLARWQALAPTLTGLSADQQEATRAALKLAVAGNK